MITCDFSLVLPGKNRAGGRWLEPRRDVNTDSQFLLKEKNSIKFLDGPSLLFISVILFLESSYD